MAETKRCNDCGEEKPLDQFYLKTRRSYRRPPRHDGRCKACANVRTQKYQALPENVVKVAEYKRRHYERVGRFAVRDRSYRKFNADQAAYDLQFHSQHERCAICLRAVAEGEDRFAFDHDHATGLARGVLCPACNGALGSLRDRRDLLLAAIRYLEYWEAQHRLAVSNE